MTYPPPNFTLEAAPAVLKMPDWQYENSERYQQIALPIYNPGTPLIVRSGKRSVACWTPTGSAGKSVCAVTTPTTCTVVLPRLPDERKHTAIFHIGCRTGCFINTRLAIWTTVKGSNCQATSEIHQRIALIISVTSSVVRSLKCCVTYRTSTTTACIWVALTTPRAAIGVDDISSTEFYI